MAARGQGEVGAVDHQEEGRRVEEHPLAAPRWGDQIAVAPCPVTVVSMVVVPPMPNLGVMAAVIANDALHGMESGTSREVAIDSAIGLVSALVIDPVIGSRSGLGSVSVIAPLIDPVIELENVSVIARKSGSATAPVPSTEIRTRPARALKTNAQGLDVFAIARTGSATAVAPGMNGANRPNAPDPALTRLVLSGRMQPRRLQRPPRQRTI